MTKKRAKTMVGIFAISYLLSYLIMTMRGEYEVTVWGLAQDPVTKEAYYRPKFPAQWMPHGLTEMPALSMPYIPLIYLDRKFWHQEKWLPSSPPSSSPPP